MSREILDLAPPPADARIPYGPDENQFGELRLPPGPGPHPLAIAIHGGYYRARYGLAYFGHCCAALAAMGVASWNVEYRRIGNPGGGWPGTFLDVAAAADVLRDLAPSYQLDITRVLALGHSAGGQLALWLAGRRRIPAGSALWSAAPLALRGVVALAPVAELRLAWQLGLSERVVGELLGGGPEQVPERYRAASPAELVPLGVRQVVVHGSEDEPVPIGVARSYVAAAQAAGDDARLVELAGAGHFEIVDPRTREWGLVARAVTELLAR
jgi:acetyl esterase/lipase